MKRGMASEGLETRRLPETVYSSICCSRSIPEHGGVSSSDIESFDEPRAGKLVAFMYVVNFLHGIRFR
jgi:hypothetical protein